MGNSSQSKAQEFQNHDRLGMIRIEEAQDAQTHQIFSIIQLSKPVHSQTEVDKWQKDISRIDDSETRQVLFLPLKHQFQKAGMCGSSGIVHLTYENFTFVLENQIRNRKGIDKYFSEAEIWYLLYNMIRAGNKFQKIKTKIGDVHPRNILINDDGQVKLISTLSFPNEITNFQKVVENRQANVFLAPEEMEQTYLKKGDYPENVDPCKAQVFSIGLTILSSATLRNCNNLYSKSENYSINRSQLIDLIKELSMRYSPILIKIIRSMLDLNPYERKRCSDLYKLLYQHQDNILDLQPFIIQEPNPVHQDPRIVQTQMRNSHSPPPPHYGYQSYGNPTYSQHINSRPGHVSVPNQGFRTSGSYPYQNPHYY